MKSSELKKLFLIVSIPYTLFACNHHCAKDRDLNGAKNPVIISPTSKDTTIIKNKTTGSPNKEYEQDKIDSIKQNKPKPKDRKGGKGD